MGKKTYPNWLPLGLTATALYTLWLYWPTLRLPLIYDSLLHIRIANSLNLANVWLPTEAFGFYRPMTFVPLLLVNGLLGSYPAALLHGMNVAQHALNVLLLVWLGKRVWGTWRVGFAAGLLFAAFPFSYQAVAVYGHNVHPTIANLLLLGLHGYLSALDSGGWKRPFLYILTTICFLLALLTHESAILFGPFAALAQWTQPNRQPKLSLRELDPHRSPWLIFLLLGVAYLVIYQFLPISRAPQAGAPSAAAIQFRALYLLQAAVFPLAWLGNKAIGIQNAAVIITVSLIIYAALVGWCVRRLQNRYPMLLAVGWWGMAYLLIGIPLSTEYLLRGPRLLYLGGIGVCLAWAGIITAFQPSARFAFSTLAKNAQPLLFNRRALYSLLSTIFLISVILINTRFVRQKLVSYEQLTQPVAAMVQVEPSDSDGVLFINLPQWLNPQRAQYPVGVEFVSMLGGYLFVEELVQFNLNAPVGAQAAVLDEQFSETAYTVGLHNQTPINQISWAADGTQHVFLTRYEPDAPSTTHMGFIGEATQNEPLATFGGYALLDATAVFCQDTITLHTQWQHDPTQATPTQTLFVQGLNEAGQLVAQADGPPLGIRPDLLRTKRPFTDIRPLPATDQPVQTILIGVYDFVTGERLEGVDGEKRPLSNNALHFTNITLCTN